MTATRLSNEARRSRRLEKQAAYQKDYRESQRAARAPSRIDVANLTLHWFVTLCLREGNHDGLIKMRAVLIEGLVGQGFDRERSARRIDEIIERYEDGWTFRPKAHLKPKPDGLTLASLLAGDIASDLGASDEED